MEGGRPLFRTTPPWLKEKTPEEKAQADLNQEWADLEEQNRRLDLPHLYGWKNYKWASAFIDSTNHMNLLTAANQISKSSTMIRRCITNATDKTRWPMLWAKPPKQFWYCMPGQKQVNAEFATKWSLFLPSGEMKDDPFYGYKVEKKGADIIGIHFNSGVVVYFKTYEQNVAALQSGTCDEIYVDEELPENLYSELSFRLVAVNGYLNAAFTATLGQEFWRLAMEPRDGEVERFPDAFKQTVSLYDAMVYEDGTPSHWSLERIKQIEAMCKSMDEVQKRVHGKFIVVGGRKYGEFDINRHMKDKHLVPATWKIYAGADPGSGGVRSETQRNKPHYPSLVYVAVAPDYRRGRVFLAWIGDDGKRYTAGDLVNKHIELISEFNLKITEQRYDYASRDFYEIASRKGQHFEKAEKRHEKGVPILNTLFKYNMLYLYDTPEIRKLATQLSTLQTTDLKRHADDDLTDSLRYASATIPWDWTVAQESISMVHDKEPDEPLTPQQQEIYDRRKAFEDEGELKMSQEFDEWNDLYGN